MRHLLVIEDEDFSRSLLAAYLETGGFIVSGVGSGERGLAAIDSGKIDVVLLDLGLPDLDGIEVLKRIRARTAIPVLIISNRERVEDRLAALEAGADDFLVKPFDPRELTARLKVVLRRSGSSTQRSEGDGEALRELRFEGWTLRFSTRDLISPDQVAVPLTPSEFNLLAALASAPLRVLSREKLLDAIARKEDAPIDRTIDVLVSRLRRKLEADSRRPQFIVTVPGFGYRFATPVTEAMSATGVR
ncbi:MAG TPA: response regulator transcription factor [Aliidongia sp.]|uniref:response regulator transcription factor n=1 Tax=Aliidongia sp. TaxID=1914230 RepID=UPI002DDD68AF|nr:response regulator transcription factor [Aliidongia sp.]HEV2678315.1 response regulator transcription factor [Aliidongia sp.]